MRSSVGPGRRQARCGQPALPEYVNACRATRFCQWLADPGWADAMAWTFDRIDAQHTENHRRATVDEDGHYCFAVAL